MMWREYLFIMLLGTGMAFSSFILVLFRMNPASGLLPLTLFYMTSGASFLGLFTIIGSCVRLYFLHKGGIIEQEVRCALRQGVLFSLLILGLLTLLSLQAFHWWTVGLLILFLASMEVTALTIRRDS
jgi:hypothetical protein